MPYGDEIDERRECFTEIKPLDLVKPFGNQESLELIDSAMWVFSIPINPLASNRFFYLDAREQTTW